ncbi:hypothetical protein ACWD5Q_00385 [Streptomyces sp. NPDC002513]
MPDHTAPWRRGRPSPWDAFTYDYQVPPDASLGHRIWSACALGLMHVGWWYGLAQPHLMFPDRHSQEGKP